MDLYSPQHSPKFSFVAIERLIKPISVLYNTKQSSLRMTVSLLSHDPRGYHCFFKVQMKALHTYTTIARQPKQNARPCADNSGCERKKKRQVVKT